MRIGYARVSTEDQHLDLQIEALSKAGCNKIFADYGISGKAFDRPGLAEAVSALHPGGKLIVWRLDRLGRSLPKLIQFVEEIGKLDAQFCSLTENIDTSSSGGRLIFHIMGALAEFERTLISERTIAGMAAARNRGVHLGRKPTLSAADIDAAALALAAGESHAVVAARLQVTSRTLRKYIAGLRQHLLEPSYE
ncbi:recombinase family protein [Rhizobium sp. CG5]|uniref:recombinase family protein n=1 Tax=Rhizobium sp. CG5 TaxID=2726076 RepID=UPI002033630E|nr:recombinase family protein [Rhizobium sp. CG5]MCM2476101.1 recombinase family protein [Rhizobium sp. CG5]